MAIHEATYTLGSESEADIAKYRDGAAMSARIREWLATPEGSMAHNPSWGHNLGAFLFEPMAVGNGLEILIEMAIARKLPLDIEDIELKGVDVQIINIDYMKMSIIHQFGRDSLEVKL